MSSATNCVCGDCLSIAWGGGLLYLLACAIQYQYIAYKQEMQDLCDH
jgi:hypothetical protein